MPPSACLPILPAEGAWTRCTAQLHRARTRSTGLYVCRPVRLNRMKYSELSTGRLIGTGQFGSVRIVTHTPTGQVYALKVSLRILARLSDQA